MEPKLLTSRQAAEYLGFSLNWIQDRRKTGGGPRYIRINSRTVRYRRQDLDRWIDAFGTREHTAQTKADPIRKSLPRAKLTAEGERWAG